MSPAVRMGGADYF